MALSAITINHVNTDFNTTGGTDFLRGNIQDNIRIDITFQSTAPLAEVELKLGFLNNFTNIYPTAGSFKIPDNYFNNANTGDIQSWRGGIGVLTPNNVKRWNEGLVRLIDNGGNNYTILALVKLKPLILFSDINNGELDVSQSGYNGVNAFKTIFEINVFDTAGITTPDHTTVDNDLSSIIKNGTTGYLNEYLNGNTPIYSVTGYQETASSFRALLSRNSGTFAVTDKVIIKFQRVTNEFNNALDLDDNLLYFEFDCLADGLVTPVSDDRIENVTATIIGGNLQIVVNYNPVFFYGVSNYAITATVGVIGTAESTHERTTALLNFKDFAYPFSSDLFELRAVDGIEKALFYNQIGTSINNASDNIEGYPEDVQLLKFNFGIKRAVYSVDEATLTNLTIKLSDDNGTFQSRSFITSQNFSQTRGLYLDANDEFNIISLDIADEENYIDNTALKVINQYTLQRFDDGNFLTDGFAVGDAITVTGDISVSANITALTAEVMTIDSAIDVQYIGKFWTVNIDNTVINVDYTNFPSTGVFNYKLYNVAYPFVILPSWVNKTGLKLEIEMAVSQVMPDSTVQSDTFVYKVNDFILYDYSENNTIDTTMTGSIQLSDEASVQLSNGIFLDQNTKVVSTFNQTGLDALLSNAIAYNNINLLAGAEQTNQYFSSHATNKTGAFIGANAVISSPSVNNLSVTSTLDYALLDDVDYRLSSRLHIPSIRFLFETDFDPLVDPTFNPRIFGTAVNAGYTFEDGSFVAGSVISTTGNGLDGTKQKVLFTADEFTNINSFQFDFAYVTGIFDMSFLNNRTANDLSVRIDNNSITELMLFETNNTIIRLQAFACAELKTLDLTPCISQVYGIIDFRNSPKLERIEVGNNTGTILQFTFFNCPNLYIGGLEVTGLTNYCNINNHQTLLYSCGFSTSQVDTLLIDIDNIAVGGFSGRIINVSAQGAPSSASLSARNSLISKGFTVITS